MQVNQGIFWAIVHFEQVSQALRQNIDNLCSAEILAKLVSLINRLVGVRL